MDADREALKVAIDSQSVSELGVALKNVDINDYLEVASSHSPDLHFRISPLAYCIKRNFVDGVIALLEFGANPTLGAYEEGGKSFLFHLMDSVLDNGVCADDAIKMVGVIKEHYIELLYQKNADGQGVVEYLLSKYQQESGHANECSFPVVHVLLSCFDERGLGQRDKLLLLPNGYNDSLIGFLIDEGADVNASGLNNETPMHRVVKHMHVDGDKKVDAIELLLKSGANPNKRDDNLKLPIDYLDSQPQNIDVGEVIKKYGGHETDAYIDTRNVFVIRNNAEYFLSEFLRYRKPADIEQALEWSEKDIAQHPTLPYSIALYGKIAVCLDKTDLLDAHLDDRQCCIQVGYDFDVCEFVWWEIIPLARRLRKYSIACKYYEKLPDFIRQIWLPELNQNMIGSFAAYGESLSFSGNDELAMVVLDEIWSKRDQVSSPWLEDKKRHLATMGSLLGSLKVDKGDYLLGELILTEAVGYDAREESAAKVNLAHCYMKQKMPEEAIPLVNSYIKKKPRSVFAWNILAKSQYLLGNDLEANMAASESLKIDPNNAFAKKYFDLTKSC